MEGRIAGEFLALDGERQSILDRVRLCASLTKPSVLPPEGQTETGELPEPWQSLGARGVTNLEGRMLMALFPPDLPWFQFTLSAEVSTDPRVDDGFKQQVEQILFLREVLVQSVLESASLTTDTRRRRQSFRSRKRKAFTQLIVTGDVLEYLSDDFRLHVLRRDQYVTRRDGSGDVVMHIVSEKKDVLSLSEEDRVAAGLASEDWLSKRRSEREMPLYTRVDWNPMSRVWVIEQEINGVVINTTEEEVSPYFSTAFDLAPEEHYGRGFIELGLGDLRSYNSLCERMLDFAAIASKQHPCLDYNSNLTEEDLMSPSGTVLRARVQGGQVQDLAWFRTDKVADFSIVNNVLERLERSLGASMLLQSASVRDSERTTATEIVRITINELEGVLGGFYAPIADDQQIPLLARTVYQLEKQGLMTKMPREGVQVKALTGVDALAREAQAARVMDLVNAVAALGPEALAKVDIGVLVDVLARNATFHIPGLIKSNEQVAAERKAAMQAQAQMMLTEKAIDTVGNIAESRATGN